MSRSFYYSGFFLLFLLLQLFLGCREKQKPAIIPAEADTFCAFDQKIRANIAKKPDSTLSVIHDLYREASQSGNYLWMVRADSFLTEYYRLTPNPDSVLFHAERMIRNAISLQDTALIIRVYLDALVNAQELGLFIQASSYGLKGLELAKSSNDSINLARLYAGMGTCSRNQNELNQATEYLIKALALAEQQEDHQAIATIRRDIATVANEMGDSALALQNFRMVLNKRYTENNPEWTAEIYNELGIFYYNRNKDSAFYYLNNSLRIFEEQQNKQMALVVRFNLGAWMMDNGDLFKAKEIFEDTYRQTLINMDLQGQSKALIMLIAASRKTRDLRSCQNYIKLADELSKKYNELDFRHEFLVEKIEYYKMLGQHAQVIACMEDLLHMKDTIQRAGNREFISSLHRQIENEGKVFEILALQRQAKIQEVEARNQQIIIYGLLILILVSLLLISVIIVYLRKNLIIRRQLEEREKELLISNETKDKFFSIIAHDLKNPFQTIFGFSDLLNEEVRSLSISQIANYSSYISDASKQAYGLLENLLIWSKTQNHSIRFTPEVLDINQHIEEIVGLLNPQATRKKITIEVNSSLPDKVYADANMMDTILRNLISNAIKFTPNEGQVAINGQQIDGKIFITVRDTGVGIPGEKLSKLFSQRIMETTVGTANEKGSGLGLILCRDFVKKHGGEISAESEPGKGTAITFYWPATLPS